MFSFLMTSLLLTLTPGPGVLYTISTGVSYGKRSSILAVIGCTLGIIPHLILGIFGVTLFSRLSPQHLAVIQSIGAFYLMTLGYKLWRQKAIDSNHPVSQTTKKELATHQFVVQPILINLLNPKLTLFFLSFLPQFVHTNINPIGQTLRLGLIFMALTFLVFLLYGLLSAHFSKLFITRPKALLNFQKFVGLIFIAYGTRIIIDTITTYT